MKSIAIKLCNKLLVLSVFLVLSACEQQPSQIQPEKSAAFVSSQPHLEIRGVPSDPFDQAIYDAADFAWGGRLYDKWWSLLDGTMDPAPPETLENHQLWPAFNTSKTGDTTWRCKSCHGWDYRGAEGVYGSRSSSYFTKIKGIIPITGGNQPMLTTPEEIYNFLHDGLVDNVSHAFGTLIADDAAFYALTKFVVTMQQEAAANRAPQNFINDTTKLTTGVEATGAAFYTLPTADGGCETCHGADGKLLDFKDGDPATPPNTFVDTYARSNPWETLHKIRFGQPGSVPMMLGLEDNAALAGQDIIQTSIDIVAHAQNGLVPSTSGFDFRVYQGTETVAQADLDLARGGILYDTWWTGVNEADPVTVPADIVGIDHALWTPAATNLTPKTGETTWRCKSCHGWDYVGADGAYGTPGGSYETGIKGFVLSNGIPPTRIDPVDIYDFLHSGMVVNADDHAFNGRISDTDLYALTRFVTEMQSNAMASQAPADFIDLTSKAVPGGNAANGFNQYNVVSNNGGCGDVCHGIDGKLIDFEDGDPSVEPNKFVADYALGNPWETLHKIRFGHPGSAMRGLIDHQNPSLGLQEAVDILSYTQAGLSRNYVRGGRLYDNWISETETDPTTVLANPLWNLAEPTLAPVLDDTDSWRCSLCHGWDYRGSPAFNSLNDLLALKETRNWQVNDVFQTLKTGYTAPAGDTGELINVHNFSEKLTDTDLWDLSAFAMEGVMNTAENLYSVGGQVRQGDLAKGFDIYFGLSGISYSGVNFGCADCHGADGLLLTGDIFTIAKTEPWRFFHTVRFGAPGHLAFPMPGMLELMPSMDTPVNNQDVANVQSFAQNQ